MSIHHNEDSSILGSIYLRTSRSSSLMLLAGELRNRIYDVLIDDIINDHNGNCIKLVDRSDFDHLEDALCVFAPTHVSQQMRRELRPLFMRCLTFRLRYADIDKYINCFYLTDMPDPTVSVPFRGNIHVDLHFPIYTHRREGRSNILPFLNFTLNSPKVHLQFTGPLAWIMKNVFFKHAHAWRLAIEHDLECIQLRPNEPSKIIGLMFKEDASVAGIEQVGHQKWAEPPNLMQPYLEGLGCTSLAPGCSVGVAKEPFHIERA